MTNQEKYKTQKSNTLSIIIGLVLLGVIVGFLFYYVNLPNDDVITDISYESSSPIESSTYINSATSPMSSSAEELVSSLS